MTFLQFGIGEGLKQLKNSRAAKAERKMESGNQARLREQRANETLKGWEMGPP